MTRSEFRGNGQTAESFRQVATDLLEQDFWRGYLRGLRRHYHGEIFGTVADHEMWMSLINDQFDPLRRSLGNGYRQGFNGVSAQEALAEAGHPA